MDREPWPDARATGPQAPAETPDEAPADVRDEAPAGVPGDDGHDGSDLGPDKLTLAGRPGYGGLASDPRIPAWIGRVVAFAVVGAAVSIWAGWRVGVTLAALVAIGDVIYRSRTTSLIPASARITSAQRRSRRRLAVLRMNGYVTLNARAIPDTRHVIDHLVVGPAGVYALDSERWDRRLPVRTATGGQLYHGPFSQRDRLEHARWEASRASHLLGEAAKRAIEVRPAMVIYGPKIPWTVVSLQGVDVFSGRRLRKYLRRQARARRAARLDAQQISLIQEAADRALPPIAQ